MFRKVQVCRSAAKALDPKYSNTKNVQIPHLFYQFQWILTPDIVYLYCISHGGRSEEDVSTPLLKNPVCKVSYQANFVLSCLQGGMLKCKNQKNLKVCVTA